MLQIFALRWRHVEFSGFDGEGFTATPVQDPSQSGDEHAFGYLALDFDSEQPFWVATVASETTSDTVSYPSTTPTRPGPDFEQLLYPGKLNHSGELDTS